MLVVALTWKPLLYESINVVCNEGHRREVSRLRLADNLDATALLFLPVQVWWLHAAGENCSEYLSLHVGVKRVKGTSYISDECSLSLSPTQTHAHKNKTAYYDVTVAACQAQLNAPPLKRHVEEKSRHSPS